MACECGKEVDTEKKEGEAMITIKFKDVDEVTLRTAPALRGVNSFELDDDGVRDALLDLIAEEILRHRPRPTTKGE